MDARKVLLIGYGNPGRGDDGLGPAFSEDMAGRGLAGLEVDTDYQLVAEHALAVADRDLVIFADAQMGGDGPFRFDPIAPGRPEVLGSHSLRPETVLALAGTLYGATPEAWVLGISGYEFSEIREGLTDEAEANLAQAKRFFLTWYAQAVGGPTSTDA